MKLAESAIGAVGSLEEREFSPGDKIELVGPWEEK